MKLLKALNNNVALVLDDERRESVVMGRGVAFHVKVGQHVNPSLVEKHYVLHGRNGRKDFDSLLKRITVRDIELASDIIKRGELRLGYRCNDSILLTLSDHLGLMMERARDGIYIGTPLEWDIRLIYPKEYAYSKEVVEKLREKTGYQIPEQEAAFIALHFINANLSSSGMQKTMMYTKVIQNILNIAKLFYGIEFRDDNFHLNRFITHVRYFVRRQMDGEALEMDLDIARVIAQKCPKDFQCAQKIAVFLKKTYGWEAGEGEILYLALHLNRISQYK